MTTWPEPAASLPQTPPDEGARLCAEQLSAYVVELRALDAGEWSKPTDCSRWDVRQIAAHVAGALDGSAHVTVLARHIYRARKNGDLGLADAINEQQLGERKHRGGPEIADEIERLTPRAVRRRLKMPRVVRRMPVPGDDLPEGSNLGYLFDVIYPRDVWLHRIDTARATGRGLQTTSGASAIVAQVVRDLARNSIGPTWVLDLGEFGRWTVGTGQPIATVHTDGIDYLRLLSGREATPALEVTGDVDIKECALAARVAF